MAPDGRNLIVCEVHHPCELRPQTEHRRDRDGRELKKRRNQVRQDLYLEKKGEWSIISDMNIPKPEMRPKLGKSRPT